MTSDGDSDPALAVHGLYVAGPNGGARHVLSDKAVMVLGRGAESHIVLDDPRVSRSHAALQLLDRPMLSDLDSANGTFIGDQRLPPGEARPLALEQSFRLGDSVLVVRKSSLQRTCAQRLTSMDQAAERIAMNRSMVVLRARASGARHAACLEPVLGELLQGKQDWMMHLGGGQVLVATPGDSEADAVRFERAALEQLISWSVAADVEASLVTSGQLEAEGHGLRGLLRGESSLLLTRGEVLLRDPAMIELKRHVTRIASTSVNVLILGETGSGKDVIATMLHDLSTRSDKPFLGVNCASFPEPLLESELFGYERGAFTGAVSAKPGLLEVAEGGSVFLDEIGDLPLPLQAKLLRVLESHEITRIGGLKARKVDVRFIAATNQNVEQAVEAGSFRRDLYYRLNGVTLTVPPLRERPTEIVPLARLFLSGACARFGTPAASFSEDALTALLAHDWPGNVRELKNAVERAVVLASARVIEPQHLGLSLRAGDTFEPRSTGIDELAENPAGERERIVRALEECGGNQSRAAKLLGIPRRTLVRKIARLGLQRPRAKA